ncbi:MAG: hypothetical protein GXP30_05130 [Verrucomicrobia bacterium]|nr:hypothetical protein [Verrucomicrobiota bacterium]
MNPQSPATRRRFLATVAAGTAGGILLPPSISLAATDTEGETDHFWYRLAPTDGPYIDTQRDNKAFGIGEEKIHFSEDNARTWVRSIDFPDAAMLNFSCILGNGNIVFATRGNIYVSTDSLKSYREIKVVDRDGSDYVTHTPKDPSKAGWYFYSLDGVHTWQVDGKEMMIWGNYCNVRSEPVPVNIYYSTDGGETVKIAYSFGQNAKYQYKGAKPASRLGNSENEVVCRHVHSVSYNAAENAFYACSGDIDGIHGHECHWLRGTYDDKADSWSWKVVASSNSNSRFKSGGINFVDGKVYWVADANGKASPEGTYDRGIFRCDPADIADKSKHTKLYDMKYEMACMTIEGGVMLAPHYGNATPSDTGFLISLDLGKTWGNYDLKQFGDRSGVRVNRKNSDGWFRVGLRQRWLDRAEVLFIKPKAS